MSMSLPCATLLRALSPFLAVLPLTLGGCPLDAVRCRSDVDCPSGEVCRSQACQAVAAAPVDGDDGTEAPAENDAPIDETPDVGAELDGGVDDAG